MTGAPTTAELKAALVVLNRMVKAEELGQRRKVPAEKGRVAVSVVDPKAFRASQLTRARCWATCLEVRAASQKHETRYEWQMILDQLGRARAERLMQDSYASLGAEIARIGVTMDEAIWRIAWLLSAEEPA